MWGRCIATMIFFKLHKYQNILRQLKADFALQQKTLLLPLQVSLEMQLRLLVPLLKSCKICSSSMSCILYTYICLFWRNLRQILHWNNDFSLNYMVPLLKSCKICSSSMPCIFKILSLFVGKRQNYQVCTVCVSIIAIFCPIMLSHCPKLKWEILSQCLPDCRLDKGPGQKKIRDFLGVFPRCRTPPTPTPPIWEASVQKKI